MNDKTEITICLGSSCFSRGNKIFVQLINSYIQENNLKDKVIFKGTRCFGNCEDGPMIKIGNTMHKSITAEKLIEILKQSIKY